VRGIDEIFADPHIAARGMLAEVEVPGLAGRTFKVAGTAIKLSETPGGVHTRAPMTGEHTAKVLAEFGFETAEIDQLKATRAVV
jgi:formyl-CoA transferase